MRRRCPRPSRPAPLWQLQGSSYAPGGVGAPCPVPARPPGCARLCLPPLSAPRPRGGGGGRASGERTRNAERSWRGRAGRERAGPGLARAAPPLGGGGARRSPPSPPPPCAPAPLCPAPPAASPFPPAQLSLGTSSHRPRTSPHSPRFAARAPAALGSLRRRPRASRPPPRRQDR